MQPVIRSGPIFWFWFQNVLQLFLQFHFPSEEGDRFKDWSAILPILETIGGKAVTGCEGVLGQVRRPMRTDEIHCWFIFVRLRPRWSTLETGC